MGSAGGGSSSGSVDYPKHVKRVHGDWLAGYYNANDPDPEPQAWIDTNMTEALNEAMANNPYTGVVAYDPTTVLDAIDVSVNLGQALVTAMNEEADWAGFLASAAAGIDPEFLDSTYVAAEIAAYNAEIDNEVTTKALPRFQRGMQDINAVVSSSFVTGQAHIEAEALRQKAKFAAQLRTEIWKSRNMALIESVNQMLKLFIGKVDFQRAVTQTMMDASKLRMVALKEKLTDQLKYTEDEAKWDIELFQHGANLIAAPHGGVVHTSKNAVPSNAIGSVMSTAGAAIGAAGMMMKG